MGKGANYSWALFVNNTQQGFVFTPFPPIIWIFTKGEIDGIESRLEAIFLNLFYFIKPIFSDKINQGHIKVRTSK